MMPVTHEDINHGIIQLHHRLKKLNILMVSSMILVILLLIAVVFHQQWLFQAYDVIPSVQTLDIPDPIMSEIELLDVAPGYFGNFMVWFFWFFIKLIAGFWAAFYLLAKLKANQRLKQHFHSGFSRFSFWLVVFLSVWFVTDHFQSLSQTPQAQMKKQVEESVVYHRSIEESVIAKEILRNRIDPTNAAYLLAQTALLQSKPDLERAEYYVRLLLRAEHNDANFEQYGFKPKQLWTMQYQVFGRAASPSTYALQQQADQVVAKGREVYHILLIILVLLGVWIAIIIWLRNNMNKRVYRIQQQMSKR